MDQKFKHHSLMTERRERLQIENYALLTESATDLRERLQEWYEYYHPTAPGECEQMEFAVMGSVQRRRVLGHITEAALTASAPRTSTSTVPRRTRSKRITGKCSPPHQVRPSWA